MWGNLKTEKNKELVANKLIKEHTALSKDYSKDLEVCDFIYYYEFVSRQSKYVMQGQKVFEFYGYEWRLPLWDIEYLRFWEKIPAQFKKNQTLYEEMLVNENWGGVWVDNMPINKKNLRPLWVIPIRFIFSLSDIPIKNGCSVMQAAHQEPKTFTKETLFNRSFSVIIFSASFSSDNEKLGNF